MKDLVTPQDMDKLSNEQLEALEQVIYKEIANIEKAREKLEEARKLIADEKAKRGMP
jgi:flagellar biosynthesis chaperone FliJ